MDYFRDVVGMRFGSSCKPGFLEVFKSWSKAGIRNYQNFIWISFLAAFEAAFEAALEVALEAALEVALEAAFQFSR